MFYVYLLHSKKDNGFYIGYTGDLKRRISEHKNGQVKSTANRKPVYLIYYEAFLLESDARAREEFLKSGYGRIQLKSILKNLFQNFEKSNRV